VFSLTRESTFPDPALGEGERQETGAQQHKASRGQCEEPARNEVMIAHYTPATRDAGPNSRSTGRLFGGFAQTMF
jgi:hypothetical protein